MKQIRLLLVTFILVLASTLSASVARSLDSPKPQESVSVHLTLGNPSDATEDVTNKDNFLMVKPQYALSYNDTKGGPNWVSWHLQASDIGNEPRGDFIPTWICLPVLSTSKRPTTTIVGLIAATSATQKTAPTPEQTMTQLST